MKGNKHKFWMYVDRQGPVHPALKTRCWNWVGGKDGKGRGAFRIDGKQYIAPRFAFYLTEGRWPVPCCLHHCDNGACVRRTHLFEGTQKDNMQDMLRKGRANKAQGSKHGRSKLTEQEVKQIRARLAKGEPQWSIAWYFGVGQGQVSRIKTGKRWRCLSTKAY